MHIENVKALFFLLTLSIFSSKIGLLPLKNSSVDISKKLHKGTILSKSGLDSPVYHLLIVCLETLST